MGDSTLTPDFENQFAVIYSQRLPPRILAVLKGSEYASSGDFFNAFHAALKEMQNRLPDEERQITYKIAYRQDEISVIGINQADVALIANQYNIPE